MDNQQHQPLQLKKKVNRKKLFAYLIKQDPREVAIVLDQVMADLVDSLHYNDAADGKQIACRHHILRNLRNYIWDLGS